MDVKLSELTFLLLAGGAGTRVKELAPDVPKALIPVNGKPFLGHLMPFLYEQGVRKVVLSIGIMGDQIRDFVGDGSQFGLEVRYCDEKDIKRGTGGAVAFAMKQGLLTDPFFLSYGDAFLDNNYQKFLTDFDAETYDGLMTVFDSTGLHHQPNLWFEDGDIKGYEKVNPTEKHSYMEWGINIYSHKCFEAELDNENFDLSLIVNRLINKHKLQGIEVMNRFYEIGCPEGHEEFKEYLKDNGK